MVETVVRVAKGDIDLQQLLCTLNEPGSNSTYTNTAERFNETSDMDLSS